jgi:hypothetical protein
MAVNLNIEGYPFACVPLDEADFSDATAIYVIISVAADGKTERYLDVGQSEEVSIRVSDYTRGKCWFENGPNKNIWVCVHRMPSDQFSQEDRLKLERYLIEKKKPSWV